MSIRSLHPLLQAKQFGLVPTYWSMLCNDRSTEIIQGSGEPGGITKI